MADPQRLERSRAMRGEGARLRCLGAGWLLHRAFGAREYHRNEWGRPELVGGGPFFSLSHSGTKVMLLVSDSPCGCDIEERIAELLDELKRQGVRRQPSSTGSGHWARAT